MIFVASSSEFYVKNSVMNVKNPCLSATLPVHASSISSYQDGLVRNRCKKRGVEPG